MSQKVALNERLASIDILRGFDMVFLVGGRHTPQPHQRF